MLHVPVRGPLLVSKNMTQKIYLYLRSKFESDESRTPHCHLVLIRGMGAAPVVGNTSRREGWERIGGELRKPLGCVVREKQEEVLSGTTGDGVQPYHMMRDAKVSQFFFHQVVQLTRLGRNKRGAE